MVDALQMREHRHPRLRFDAGDQALAAAGHDDVDGAGESGQQQSHRGAIAGRHQRDRGFGETRLAQPLRQAGVDRAAGAETVGAAAQDHRVAGFQAQHAGVSRNVGTALKNHGDDAERHTHALDGHAVRTLPAFGHDADRIGDFSHRRNAVGHRIDARLRQRQAVDKGAGRAAAADFSDVFGVGGQDRGGVLADRPLHCLQGAILLLPRGK